MNSYTVTFFCGEVRLFHTVLNAQSVTSALMVAQSQFQFQFPRKFHAFRHTRVLIEDNSV